MTGRGLLPVDLDGTNSSVLSNDKSKGYLQCLRLVERVRLCLGTPWFRVQQTRALRLCGPVPSYSYFRMILLRSKIFDAAIRN